MEDESNRTLEVVNRGQNLETGPVSVQLSHSQEGSRNVDDNPTNNHEAEHVINPTSRNVDDNPTNNHETEHVINPGFLNVVDNEEINGSSAPPLMSFNELMTYVGASAAFSSILLGFLQLSRNESHRPFHSHHTMSMITVGVVIAIVIGLFIAAITHTREALRGVFVFLSYLICALAVLACILVGVLVILP